MFIKTRQEPWHGPPTPDARKPRIHRDGARSKPSSNKPIHNDKQHQRRAELFAHCKSLQSARRPSLQPTPLACATRASQWAPGAKPSSPTRRPSTAKRRTSPGAQIGGGERNRTVDLLLAKQALSQLSYTPVRSQKSDVRSQIRTTTNICTLTSVFRLPDWWAGEDLNLRPHAYQARALTN